MMNKRRLIYMKQKALSKNLILLIHLNSIMVYL